MQHVFPDYYRDFRCISSRCRHNCCIGWEIDIDRQTAEFYQSVSGEFGKRLKANISDKDEPYFILGEDERCPFLNDRNLCDIITTLGEEQLCTICAEHPRFHNELPGHIESGLGLCCEEAARIIISRKEPVHLEMTCGGGEDEAQTTDEIIILRDELIALLQDRSMTVPERIAEMQHCCGAILPDRSISEWAEFFGRLEQLDSRWTELLERLGRQQISPDTDGFDRYMADRQTEYEQLLVYILYRHFANAPSLDYTAARANFAALAYTLLHALGAMIWRTDGSFPLEQQIDLARMFSSEIEYSDENLCILLDELDLTEEDM